MGDLVPMAHHRGSSGSGTKEVQPHSLRHVTSVCPQKPGVLGVFPAHGLYREASKWASRFVRSGGWPRLF